MQMTVPPIPIPRSCREAIHGGGGGFLQRVGLRLSELRGREQLFSGATGGLFGHGEPLQEAPPQNTTGCPRFGRGPGALPVGGPPQLSKGLLQEGFSFTAGGPGSADGDFGLHQPPEAVPAGHSRCHPGRVRAKRASPCLPCGSGWDAEGAAQRILASGAALRGVGDDFQRWLWLPPS